MLSFISDPQNARFHDAFVAHIPAVSGKTNLLRTLASRLLFPTYFGMNWDALIDCLSDFGWLPQRHVVIVHDHFPELSRDELMHYVGCLLFAIARYAARPDAEHDEIDVVFPLDSRDIVLRAIEDDARRDACSTPLPPNA